MDQRSFCKKGSGGTSTIDALSFYRRRPDVETEIVEFDDRMIAKNRKKDAIEDAIAFQIDFQNWKNKLTRTELNILQLLLAGYKELKITELLKLSYSTVKENIKRIQQAYQEYFCREVLTTP